MLENLKLQLQNTFELELLKNRNLKIPNLECEIEEDFVAATTLDWMIMYFDDEYEFIHCVDEIVHNAIKNILKNGAAENIYTIYWTDDYTDYRKSYPLYICTDVRAAMESLNNIECSNIDMDDYFDRELLKEHLYVTLHYYKDDEMQRICLY